MRGRRILLATVVTVVVLAVTTVAVGATRHPNAGQAGRQSAGPATVIVGGCKAAKVDFAANDVGTSTTSTSFVDLPGASVTFSIGGAATSCVVADYSGQAFAPSPRLLFIQALLDGASLGAPSPVQLVGGSADTFSDSYSMQFVWPSVAPGVHTVKIQFRSFEGGSVAVNRGTLVVQHK